MWLPMPALSDMLQQIYGSRIPSRARRPLYRVAVQEYVRVAAAPPAPGPQMHVHSSAITDLEQVYALLSRVAGTPISRPAAAIALLRLLGLRREGLDARFSRLTSRRKHEAHPDAPFLASLTAARPGLRAHRGAPPPVENSSSSQANHGRRNRADAPRRAGAERRC